MRTKKAIGICLLISIAGGLISALLRTVALLTNYNVVSGHFDLGSAETTVNIGWTVAIITCVAVCAICFTLYKRLVRFERVAGKTAYIIGATALVFTILVTMFEALSEKTLPDSVERTLNLAIALFGGISCATVFANAFVPSNKVNLVRATVSLAPAMFVVMPGYRSYFDAELIMNCPNKTVYIIAACAAALMIISECRFFCPKPTPMTFTVSACATVVFGLFCAVPNIVYFIVNGTTLLTGFGADFAILGFAVFAVTQLCSMHHKTEK